MGGASPRQRQRRDRSTRLSRHDQRSGGASRSAGVAELDVHGEAVVTEGHCARPRRPSSPHSARRDRCSTGAPGSISSCAASSIVAASAEMASSAHVGRSPRSRERVVEAGGHPGLQEAGEEDLVEVGVLHADDLLVTAAQPLPVDDGVTGRDAQGAGDPGTGLLATGERGSATPAAGPRRFMSSVKDDSWTDAATRLRDEGSATGHPLEEALGRPVRRAPGAPSSGRRRSVRRAHARRVPRIRERRRRSGCGRTRGPGRA